MDEAKVRQGLIELAQFFDRMSTYSMENAKSNAIDILNGVEGAEIRARVALGKSHVYKEAMSAIDELRRNLKL